MSFDWKTPKASTVPEQLSQEKARQFAIRMQEALEKGKEFIKKAQEKKEKDINKYRRLIDFQVKDKVFISTKNWKTECPSRKLDH